MSKRVGVAIGHGGSDSGAVGGSFIEKTMNLKVGLRMHDRLNALGFTTILNRTTDTVGGEANFADSIAEKVDFAVAVHFNMFSDPSANGFEVGRNRNHAINESILLCQLIEKHVKSDIKIRSRGVKVFDFAMTNNTYPCAYLEGGFISSPIDRAYFDSDEKLNVLAEAYVKGICEYAGVTYNATGDFNSVPQTSPVTNSLKVNITSYDAFKADTNEKEFDTDNTYGAQCFDGADLLWRNIGGNQPDDDPNGGKRRLRCVGGSVKNAVNSPERNYNAGTEFEYIGDCTKIKRGDVIVFGTTLSFPRGHIGYADEDYSNGKTTIACYGQNQGGSVNGTFKINNYDKTALIGAFRYRKWNNSTPLQQQNPQPKPVVPTAITYTVVDGNTMTGIATRFGVALSALIEANPQITNPNVISIGQVLNIPSVAIPIPSTNNTPTPQKSVEEVAWEIWRGQGGWGNDPERRQKLIAYGGEQFRNDVQSRVNQIVRTGK